MNIVICCFDCFARDSKGKTLFVLDTESEIDLPFLTIIAAHIFVSKIGETLPCEIYRPRPNNPRETKFLQMRSDQKLGLWHLISIGDVIIVGDGPD